MKVIAELQIYRVVSSTDRVKDRPVDVSPLPKILRCFSKPTSFTFRWWFHPSDPTIASISISSNRYKISTFLRHNKNPQILNRTPELGPGFELRNRSGRIKMDYISQASEAPHGLTIPICPPRQHEMELVAHGALCMQTDVGYLVRRQSWNEF